MKPRQASAVLTLFCLGLAPFLQAETDAAKAADKPDPFVKAKAAAKPAEQSSDNMLFTFETYALPQADYLSLIESGAASPEIYRRTAEAAKNGKAALENVLAISTRSGQRATVEQVDEVRYATEFRPEQSKDGFPFPSTYEVRGAGDRLEVDPVASEDRKSADIAYALDAVRLPGFTEYRTNPSSVEGTQVQALFETRRTTSSVTLANSQMRLLGTLGRAAEDGTDDAEETGTTRVVFAQCRPVMFGGEVVEQKPGPKDAPLLRISTCFYSMNRNSAQTILNSSANGDALQASVADLVKKQQARLERVLTSVTKSGQRTSCEETHEYRYPTQYEADDSQGDGKKETAAHSGTAFEMRPVGWRMEVDSVLGPDGRTVDVNIAPEFTRFVGSLSGNEFLEKHCPPQPVFELHKITTCATLPAGHHLLLGTISPPRDTNVNGRGDDGKVWLAFLRVDVE